MKRTIIIVLLFVVATIQAQQAYYNDVDVTLTGQDLYFALQAKINQSNPSFTYNDAREALRVTDLNPEDSDDVLLIYGYQNDSNCITDRTRDVNNFGGNNCNYNREHVFSRSNANPSMGSTSGSTTGIGADPHNLRSSDVQMNGNRGSRLFTEGSGNAGPTSSNGWYPGDEWKGDAARMMMYMYTRYGDRCLPSLNGSSALQSGTQMLEIYLQWNVEDPVSDLERQRNPYLQQAYGNRNPFIDQPLLATMIWGGPEAEDIWATLATSDTEITNITLYPNPAHTQVTITNTTSFVPSQVIIYDTLGRKVFTQNNPDTIDVTSLDHGMYLFQFTDGVLTTTERVIIN